MGAGASGTGKDKDLNDLDDPQQPTARNYVPICSPPHYDLTFDSTDSEITELQVERSKKPIPLPFSGSPVPRGRNEELSQIAEEILEEQATVLRLEEEPTIQSVEETIRVSNLDEGPASEDQGRPSSISKEPSPISGPVPSTCDLNGRCANPDLCKLRRCQRQVSFAKEVNYCDNPYCARNQQGVYEESVQSLDDECSCTEEELESAHCGCHCQLHRVEEESDEEEEDDEEVMPDYQRYSREQPEKDSNPGKKGPDFGNMRDSCRACCPNRTASLKHNNAQLNNSASNACRCSRSQAKPGNRHTSESYVSCRGLCKNPSHSKSAPNQLEDRDSYHHFQEIDHNRHFQQRRSPLRKNKPRSYPPAHGYEAHVNQERPHIPLPPPQQQFSSEQPMVPPHQNLHQHPSRNSRDSRDAREEHDERKEMYSHNTNRNYATKTPYSRTYNRQSLKPYPYEEPQGSTSYNDSTCSNNCSGYDHCPMHHGCRCQCLCSDDSHYGPQGQSDDQLSFCSDSSNSECMNLAYQRTGDYPELMDELETTLSHRNRIRVQKTMQRFEMLSRQNKNLEKPIFEDEESLRHYNMGMNMHRDKRDGHQCKCRHCEEKYRRQNTINTRSEALAKRPNYQPTPFPRNSGYVEKVARYMDPNLNLNRRENNPRKKQDDRHEMPTTMTNGNGTWQMDARKNEWVKVDQGHAGGGPNQYDFESNYPPLPPRPISENMYDRRSFGHDRHDRGPPCSCPKCLRRR